MKTKTIDTKRFRAALPTVNAVLFGHSCEEDLLAGETEIKFYPCGDGWRVETRVEPADPQFNDFASRAEAVEFFATLIGEVVAGL